MIHKTQIENGRYKRSWTAVGVFNGLGALTILAFWLWAKLDQLTLYAYTREDTGLENLTALFFLLASLAMCVAILRHPDIRKRKLRAILPACWCLLFVVFAGEEISWGQRIFDLPVPGFLQDGIGQDELNIHNLRWVNTWAGGKFRWLSILVLTTGVLMPLATLNRRVHGWFGKITLPVVQPHYVSLFLGGYLYCKLLYPQIGDVVAEVREFLFSLGYLLFAIHGAYLPLSLAENPMPTAIGKRGED